MGQNEERGSSQQHSTPEISNSIQSDTNERTASSKWYIFEGKASPSKEKKAFSLPSPPPWRNFSNSQEHKGNTFQVSDEQIKMVNAALYLRRPLLITGLPGTGKSSLAYAVANELGLGQVLKWPITSRSKLKDGLYTYDAVGRLQSSNLGGVGQGNEQAPIGDFLRLGPLGTAYADSTENAPRVLLIDEIDKSDIDLPNDLLNVFEDGEFEIPELLRNAKEGNSTQEESISILLDRPRDEDSRDRLDIVEGRVKCQEFPFIILTSNGERELPAPFLRRCLRLEIQPPDERALQKIVKAHFQSLSGDEQLPPRVVEFIRNVVKRRNEKKEYVATDQLLNAIHLILNKKIDASMHEDAGQIQKFIEKSILEKIGTSI